MKNTLLGVGRRSKGAAAGGATRRGGEQARNGRAEEGEEQAARPPNHARKTGAGARARSRCRAQGETASQGGKGARGAAERGLCVSVRYTLNPKPQTLNTEPSWR